MEGAGADPDGFLRAEVLKIRWLFMELLMNAILESIDGEAEISLMESGIENHIYTREADVIPGHEPGRFRAPTSPRSTIRPG